jgi:hypothetical protein
MKLGIIRATKHYGNYMLIVDRVGGVSNAGTDPGEQQSVRPSDNAQLYAWVSSKTRGGSPID